MKHANAVECKVPGRPSSGKPVPRVREIHFISKIPPAVKKSRPQKRCVLR
jgi:hypothetical protein